MVQKAKVSNYLKFFLFSVFVALVVAIIAGMFMGYKYILVNGDSARQKIPRESFILTFKCEKTDVYVNDFVTINNSGSYVTHQVIGIKYDGYFQPGECYSWEMNGNTYHAYYGYQSGGDSGNITAKSGGIPSAEIQEHEISNMDLSPNYDVDCNLITMANSADGNARKEYRNFEEEFVGKVIWHNYTLGKTLFILKDSSFKNRLFLFGILGSIVMVFVMSKQSELEIGYYD